MQKKNKITSFLSLRVAEVIEYANGWEALLGDTILALSWAIEEKQPDQKTADEARKVLLYNTKGGY